MEESCHRLTTLKEERVIQLSVREDDVRTSPMLNI